MATKVDVPRRDGVPSKEPSEAHAYEAAHEAASFDDRELGEPEVQHQSNHHDDELNAVRKDGSAGAASFDDRELGEPEVQHQSNHDELNAVRKDGSAGAASFDDRELDECEVEGLEGNPMPADAPPARRGSLRSVLNAIEQREKELKELEARENTVETHLQVYSEVVALRKELGVVKQDTERMRRQFADIDELVASYDPAVERDLESAEEEAQRSSVQQLWTSTCQQKPDDSLDNGASWLKLDVAALPQRVKAARDEFRAADAAGAELYKLQEEKINSNTDEREKAKAKLSKDVKAEMAKLVQARSRLKQLDDDQRHHFHRGTHVKERVLSSQRERDALRGRVYNDEAKQSGEFVVLEDELKELTAWVKNAKRELEDNKRSYAEEQRELQEQLQVVEDNGKEARELRARFERENEELKSLKQELQQVLIYARIRHREEFA